MAVVQQREMGILIILATVFLSVLGATTAPPQTTASSINICRTKTTCEQCVATKISATADNEGACIFVVLTNGVECRSTSGFEGNVRYQVYSAEGCTGTETSVPTTTSFSVKVPTNGTTTTTERPTVRSGRTTAFTTTTAQPKHLNTMLPTTQDTTSGRGDIYVATEPVVWTSDDYPLATDLPYYRPTTFVPPTNATTTRKPHIWYPRRDLFAWIEFLCGIAFASFVYIILHAFRGRKGHANNNRTLLLQLPANMEHATVKMSIQNGIVSSPNETEYITHKV